jgi:Na+/H+ antiporter NhaD/arsenite permease-like protein
MHNGNGALSGTAIAVRGTIMICVSLATGFIAYTAGLHENAQVLATAIFFLIISATLLFWNFRLAIAFIGIAILLGGRVLSLEQMLTSSELEIILFLVGMMVMIGVLKDIGLFTWVIQLVINMKRMSGVLFTIILVFMSAIMACAVDEVTSIVFVLALVFQVCDTLKIRPIPFVMIAVLATNIGSSGTMLGNPVGILIGTKAGLTFQDFIVWAFPVMMISLVAALGLVILYYRNEIKQFTRQLEERRKMQMGLGPLVEIPYKKGLAILGGAITLIALHHQLETWLDVEKNTLLIVAPLAISGILMVWRNQRARHYIESEVEWWTLLFFMMLFAVAGSLEHTGVTEVVAKKFQGTFGTGSQILTPVVIFVTAIGSAFVDNIVFVAAFIPVVKALNLTPLWWAMLFGACFGGNITVIGSTANIVAIGMLEKRYKSHIGFLSWLKIGAIVGVVTCLIAWGAITLLTPFMPAMPDIPAIPAIGH